MKSKKSTAVIQAFENIYRRAPNPVYLQTDRGTEFTNKALEKWLRQQNISLFQTYNFDTKAALAERLIRTLKTFKAIFITSTKLQVSISNTVIRN